MHDTNFVIFTTLGVLAVLCGVLAGVWVEGAARSERVICEAANGVYVKRTCFDKRAVIDIRGEL